MKKKSVVVILFALAFCCGVHAGPEDRDYWRHDKGNFHAELDKRWIERSPDGFFYFDEIDRTRGYVEMYDKSRKCWVRLTADSCYVKFGTGEYKKYYSGRWSNQ